MPTNKRLPDDGFVADSGFVEDGGDFVADSAEQGGSWYDRLANEAAASEPAYKAQKEAYQQRHAADTPAQRLRAFLLGNKDNPVVQGAPPLALPATALPKAVSALAEAANASAPRRVALGAAQGAVSDPEHPIKGAAKGGLWALGGEVVSKGLEKGGDVLMQLGVGRKKYTPGVGTTLAEEGLVGTKGMLKGQTERGLQRRGEDIRDAVAAIDPRKGISAAAVAEGVENAASRPLIGKQGLTPSVADQPKIAKITEFADDIAKRGVEAPVDALQRRVAAGTRGYAGKEDPLQSLVGQMSKNEQRLYSSGLKDAASQTSPELGSKLAKADTAYGALKRAQKSLSEDPSLPHSLFSLLSMGPKTIPGGPLLTTALGQAMSKGSVAAELANNPILRQIILQKNSTHRDEQE